MSETVPDPVPVVPLVPDVDDPSAIIPLEAARAHLRHWWREPAAGAAALAIGCFDAWHYGNDLGLTASIDELLIIGGIVLVAGSRRLFGASAPGDDRHPNQ